MSVPFTTGVHRLAPETFAYVQGSRATGYSNAGLVCSGEEALLVDTLYTLDQTRQMLSAITKAVPATDICWVVNTHQDGDHWWGNQLVGDALIVSSTAAARRMREAGPETMEPFLAADTDPRLRAYLEAFDFSGITPTYPTITFTGEMELTVGSRTVRLIEVGPAHTEGDVIVHVPDAGVVYAGDILMFGGHGVIHSGPVGNCIRACDTILDLGAETVVPGHGPVGGKSEVIRVRDYLERVQAHATTAHQQGKSALEAAREFGFDEFSGFANAERVVLNIGAVYRELNGDGTPGMGPLLHQMVELKDTLEAGETA
ncbi:MBL fold metallo-hydrolase [Streptomyces pactum]|uniref:MBL fold metallo-hydrolase n=1 Tax=Streptomyces pactum TaxID=68249 RepID=A0A7T1XZF7_9ACTN|nr:MBL fold metallo-hydrolase [Streptomyces pactum]MBH5333915.1 MBL fold metallo-hydrolase [Streptomyces pactum]QPP46752.1 MBL fold metallo-hydrolase [Streptomyces pactum]